MNNGLSVNAVEQSVHADCVSVPAPLSSQIQAQRIIHVARQYEIRAMKVNPI
jgi:hypothetical protein